MPIGPEVELVTAEHVFLGFLPLHTLILLGRPLPSLTSRYTPLTPKSSDARYFTSGHPLVGSTVRSLPRWRHQYIGIRRPGSDVDLVALGAQNRKSVRILQPNLVGARAAQDTSLPPSESPLSARIEGQPTTRRPTR